MTVERAARRGTGRRIPLLLDATCRGRHAPAVTESIASNRQLVPSSRCCKLDLVNTAQARQFSERIRQVRVVELG